MSNTRKILITKGFIQSVEVALTQVKTTDARYHKLLAMNAMGSNTSKTVMANFQVSHPTLYNWVKRFKEQGIEGLSIASGRDSRSIGEKWQDFESHNLYELGINLY